MNPDEKNRYEYTIQYQRGQIENLRRKLAAIERGEKPSRYEDPPDTTIFPEDMTYQQTSALIAWHLAMGRRFSSYAIGDMLGYRRESAYRLMVILAAVLPIYQDANEKWRKFDAEEEAEDADG